nr:hypothetical protein [Tanacetum cinerariifolium]
MGRSGQGFGTVPVLLGVREGSVGNGSFLAGKLVRGYCVVSCGFKLAFDTQKAIKGTGRAYKIHQQIRGSSKGAGITLEVLDEPKGKSKGSNKGAGITPEVLDEPKGKSTAKDDDWNFSSIIAPLTGCMKGGRITWTSEAAKAFDILKAK